LDRFEGSVLAIPPTVDIHGLQFRSRGNASKLTILRNIATAFQQYGGYGIDSGSVAGVQLRLEFTARGDVPPLEGEFLDDLGLIAAQLRVVTNSYHPGTGGPPEGGVRLHGGDGELLAPLAPPFARVDAGSGKA